MTVDYFHPRQKRDGDLEWSEGGITLRDHIAISILPALIENSTASPEYKVKEAYRYADMIVRYRAE